MLEIILSIIALVVGLMSNPLSAGAEIVEETGSLEASRDPYWWLNSGAEVFIKDGVGSTIQGDLPLFTKWRHIYDGSNPIDTDQGLHPQNILRLVTKESWQNLEQEAYFKINNLNLSDSPNRNASNGLLFFNRYLDGDNLYYAGIRVDGQAVIKKKINGTYYTMAITPIYGREELYSRETNPNLIPENQWIGVRSKIWNDKNGKVNIELSIDKENNGNWIPVLRAIDEGKIYGGQAIAGDGHAGIRTDFMDVEFRNYQVKEIGIRS